jgi:glycosyltransferase involved in cell wall biosynthesis
MGEPNPNVIVVAPSDGGGMLHYCSQMANALSAKATVTAIVDDGADESLFDGVAVETMDFPGTIAEIGPGVVTLWTQLYRRLSAEPIDVVHTTVLNPLLVPPLLALRRQPQRTVITLHDVSDHPGAQKYRNEIARQLLVRGVDRVVVHGEYNARQCRQRYGVDGTLVTIDHGAYSFFTDYCDGPIRYDRELLFFGRFRPYKGIETLLEADRLVSDAVDDYRLTIAGEGRLDVSEAELGDHVTVINEYVPNETVCELFSRCRAVVLPYTEASQSGIVPIAYSFRKPVITTTVGGLPEVVTDGSTGLAVEPEDPNALADACVELLEDEMAAVEMGDGGYEFKNEHMSWDRIAEALLKEYWNR